MNCVYLNTDGTLTSTNDTIETCAGYVLVTATDARAFTSASQINSLDIAEAFTWGFGTVILFAILSYKVKVARQVIKLT